ncbi:matrixin family metalloprotease [Sporosarcina sp. SAFN-015]|uniref:matrixin family metalloprotease n=1 Tax=Sporosarcina sp. SAFN-015 TaxID=3387274 RepID=UPI003F801006
MNKYKKKLIFIFSFLLCLLVLTNLLQRDVFAYELKGHRQGNPSFISYKWGSGLTSSMIQNGWTKGGDSWRVSTKSYVRFYYNSGSVNTFSQYYIRDYGDYGEIIYLNISGGLLTRFEAKLNEYAILTNNVAQSVAVHEMGHALGLSDLSSGASIMNHNRNRAVIITPQTDDLNGIRAIYGEF